jgi:hypothetical protein
MTHLGSINQQLSSRRDVEELITTAKIARSRFLKDRYGPLCKTLAQAAAICGIVCLLIYERPASEVALDGTVRMNRVADELAHAKAIPPNSVQQISRLLREPGYDCAQVSCGSVLKHRNRRAREKLEAVLTKASPPLVVSIRQTPGHSGH